MKAGLVTETCVIAYCSGCGDAFGDNGCGHPLLFASTEEAVAFLTNLVTSAGWQFDGEHLTCDGCIATAYCNIEGHDWGPWEPHGPQYTFTEFRGCNHCGVLEFRETT
ncbi:hypothetical protein [Nocardia terpenica]|uniref:Uncharacterized protein n=1 Tax=Nocardia terpenica TaxID=455432 RepID=A0A6G9Z127_9NOCA|nr:hypothetical protein [Nocardia terpenica]QIS19218.1 hypothetical protein F6W96_13875 [Nocardia terpenica]